MRPMRMFSMVKADGGRRGSAHLFAESGVSDAQDEEGDGRGDKDEVEHDGWWFRPNAITDGEPRLIKSPA